MADVEMTDYASGDWDFYTDREPSVPPPASPPRAPVYNLEPIEADNPSEAAALRTATVVATILSILSDVDSDYVFAYVHQHLPTYGQEEIVDVTVRHLLDNPQRTRLGENDKGKGRAQEDNDNSGATQATGKRKSTDGEAPIGPCPLGETIYTHLAIAALEASFPSVSLLYIREQLTAHAGLYAPTHLFLRAEEERRTGTAQTENAGGTVDRDTEPSTSKGKARALVSEDFDEEQKWLEYIAEDECQCCFTPHPVRLMAECPRGHHFCRECIEGYAEAQLGARNTKLNCMHTDGCDLPYGRAELVRFLTPALFSLYERLVQQQELRRANIEGLEECPFCDWACVMEISLQEESLFRCGNAEGGCGKASCRMCRKEDHLPKTCNEAADDEDPHLRGRLAVEEAMTNALMRRCPSCGTAFVKAYGCNKMICTTCRAVSCYICRQLIQGYDHFSDGRNNEDATVSSTRNCPLYDAYNNPEIAHARDVRAARDAALAAWQAAHPNAGAQGPFGADADDIDDIPDVPAALNMADVEEAVYDAQDEVRRARNRLRYAERRLREIEEEIRWIESGHADAHNYLAGGRPKGKGARRAVDPYIEQALRQERVDRATAELEGLEERLEVLREHYVERQRHYMEWERVQMLQLQLRREERARLGARG